MDMKGILHRVSEAAERQKMSDRAVSVAAGLSGDAIRNWRRRLRNGEEFGVNAASLSGVADALGVSVEWLREGQEISAPVRVDDMDSAPSGAALVPVYDVFASAGHGAIVGDEYVSHTLAFPPDYLSQITRSSPKNLSIIGVKGDSMEPTLKDDDIVMLDRSKRDLSYDGLFVVRFGDALHVKRASRSARKGFVKIISDNTVYPPEEHPATDVEVIGKVIWSGGKL